jgi:YVTN family beta-propeller protein
VTQAQKTLAFLTGKRIMNKNGCSMKPLTAICQFLWLVTLLAAMPSASHAQSAPDFKVYVALPNTNSVAVIDGLTNAVLTTIPIAAANATGTATYPYSLALTPDARYLYVVDESCGTGPPIQGSVSVVDTLNNSVVATIPAGTCPTSIAITPDGTRAYVTNYDETVPVIDTSANAVLTNLTISAQGGLAISPDGRHVYFASGFPSDLAVIDTATNTVVSGVNLVVSRGPGVSPETCDALYQVAVTPDGSQVYVDGLDCGSFGAFNTSLALSSPSTSELFAAIYGILCTAGGIGVTPDGKHAYVLDTGCPDVYIVDTTTFSITTQTSPTDLSGFFTPYFIAFSPDSKFAYLSGEFTGGASYVPGVMVVDTTTNTFPPTLSIPLSVDPAGMAVSPANNTAAGMNVAVQPVDQITKTSPVTVTFANVTQPGFTSLITSSTGPTPPTGFQLGNPAVYYNLATTAQYPPNVPDSITICVNYSGISFGTSTPTLYHFENSAWVPVPTTSLDTVNQIICGSVSSLSPFALFQSAGGNSTTMTSLTAPGVTYGTPASVTVSVSSTGGAVAGNVTLTVDGGAPSTMALSGGSAVFNLGFLNSGLHALSANFAAQGGLSASSAAASLAVAPAPASVSPSPATKVYGMSDPSLNGTLSGFLAADHVTASYSRTPGESAGALYTITATLGPASALNNYTVAYHTAPFTITKAQLTIAANNATKTLNAVNPTFTSTDSGFVNGENSSVLTATPTCTTTATTISPVGSFPITCSGANAANYTFSYVPGTLKIVYAPNVGHAIQPPINPDGTSVFKQGRTVPAKFNVYDSNGVSIGTAGVVSSFYLTGILSGTTTTSVEDVADTNNPDTSFRWDGQEWIFNITTGNLTAGSTYSYTIVLNDGSTIMFQYGLR